MTDSSLKLGVLMIGPSSPALDEKSTVVDNSGRRPLVSNSLGGQAVLIANLMTSRLAQHYKMEVLDVNHSHPGVLKRFALGLKFVFRLAVRLLVDCQISLIHIHTSSGMAFLEKSIFMLISRLFRRRVLLHIHGGRFREFWQTAGSVKRNLIRYALSLNHGLIVLGDSWIPFYREDVGYRGKLFSLPNSVQIVPLKSVNKDDKVRMLFVGHIKREKGLLDLFEALTSFTVEELAGIQILLMGRGDNEQNELQVRNAYAASGLNCVEFLGVLEGNEKWQVFADADIFILPSHSEDMPLTILEAMAFGKPVISTDIGFISSVVRDGVDGFLVPAHDVAALSKAMRRLVTDVELRKKLGCSAQKNFEENFSFINYENNLDKIYQEILIDNS